MTQHISVRPEHTCGRTGYTVTQREIPEPPPIWGFVVAVLALWAATIALGYLVTVWPGPAPALSTKCNLTLNCLECHFEPTRM